MHTDVIQAAQYCGILTHRVGGGDWRHYGIRGPFASNGWTGDGPSSVNSGSCQHTELFHLDSDVLRSKQRVFPKSGGQRAEVRVVVDECHGSRGCFPE